MSSIGGKGPTLPPSVPTPAQADQMARHAAGSGVATPPPAARAEQAQAARGAEQPTAPRRASGAEAERLAAQSGYAKMGPKKRRGYEMDDPTEAPIPLPVDEVDPSAWDQAGLDDAQQELTLQGAQLKGAAQEAAATPTDVLGLVTRLLERGYSPTDEDVARLARLEEAPAAALADLEAVTASMRQHFALEAAAMQSGTALVAASLVVAGLRDAVQPEAGTGAVGAAALGQGMQQLVERSSAAVRDARQMHSGISLELARHRTFLHKR